MLTNEQRNELKKKYFSGTTTAPSVSDRIKRVQDIAKGVETPQIEQPEQKTLGGFGKNVLSSAGELAKNVGSAIMHPVQTAKSLLGAGVGLAEKTNLPGVNIGSELIGSAFLGGKDKPDEYANALTQSIKDRYGSIEKAKETAYNDPVGFLLDASIVLGGAGTAVSKVGSVTKAVGEGTKIAQTTSKVGQVVSDIGKGAEIVGKTIDPFSLAGKATKVITKPITNTAKGISEYAITKITGFNPETVQTLVKNPEAVLKAKSEGLSRVNLADYVKESLDAKIQSLSELGKNYEGIRKSSEIVNLPKTTQQFLSEKYGLIFDEAGNVSRSSKGTPLAVGDVNAINDFLSLYGKEQNLTAEQFLNARSYLSELAKFDTTKSGAVERISAGLRKFYDEQGKGQIKGLEVLDKQYSPEVTLLNKLKKDYLNPDGTLKDGAINKLANITGKGKDQVLDRLSQIAPEIEQRAKIIQSLEDVGWSGGQKVGTYFRDGASVSSVTAGIVTGNPLLVIGGFLVAPQVLAPLLLKYGKIMGYKEQAISGLANKIKSGTKLTEKEATAFKNIVQTISKYTVSETTQQTE